MAFDLGDVATLAIQIKDATGTLANAGTVTCTVTAPDATTSLPTVVNGSTGNYQVTFTPTQIGLYGVRWVATGANAGSYTDVLDVADPAYLPVVSLTEAKDYLNITTSSYDEKLRGLITTATAIAEQYCNRAIARKTITQTFSGGKTFLQLWMPEVLNLVSVVENGVTLAATDYVLNKKSGILFRGTYAYTVPWIIGVDNVTVTYVAGQSAPAADLRDGVLEILRWKWNNTQQNGRPGYTSSQDQGLLSDALPKWLMRPLAPYRMPGLG
jgi:hypothetical protein